MKLILESACGLDGEIQDELNESTGAQEKSYYISGIFSTPDVKNKNGRIYPRDMWVREVEKYQKEIINKTNNSLGEWQHPPRNTVDPMKAVIRMVELKMTPEGDVWGKAKILNDNSPETNKLKALIKEGVKIGVSTRGVGKVSASGVVEQFSLTTIDCVDVPSNHASELTGMVEGFQMVNGIIEDKEYKIDENGCIGECSLDTINESEQDDVLAKLKNDLRKAGFKSWEFEGDYEKLLVTFKDNKTALNAFRKFKDEIGFVSTNAEVENGVISLELNEKDTIYKNVDAFKELLAEKDADKMCDLSLEEKEEILSKFLESSSKLDEASIYKNLFEEIITKLDEYMVYIKPSEDETVVETKSIDDLNLLEANKWDKIDSKDIHIIGDYMSQKLRGKNKLTPAEEERFDKLMTKYDLYGKDGKGSTVDGFMDFLRSKDYLNEAKLNITPKFQKWLDKDMGDVEDDGKYTIYKNKAGSEVFKIDNKKGTLVILQKDLEAIDLEKYGAELILEDTIYKNDKLSEDQARALIEKLSSINEATDIVSILDKDEVNVLKDQFYKLYDAVYEFQSGIEANKILDKIAGKDYQKLVKAFDKFNKEFKLSEML